MTGWVDFHNNNGDVKVRVKDIVAIEPDGSNSGSGSFVYTTGGRLYVMTNVDNIMEKIKVAEIIVKERGDA